MGLKLAPTFPTCRRLLPRRPLQLRQGRRAGVLDRVRPRLHQRPGCRQRESQAYGKRYHQASDEYDPSWDLSGMVQTAQYTLNLGRLIANGAKLPEWKKGDAFAKPRN
jgi:hypothetical protein